MSTTTIDRPVPVISAADLMLATPGKNCPTTTWTSGKFWGATLLSTLLSASCTPDLPSAQAAASGKAPVKEFVKMTPADHLAAAKEALEANDLNKAARHLSVIPSSAAEQAEAQHLRKQVKDAEGKKADIERAAKRASDEDKLKVVEAALKKFREKRKKYYATTDDVREMAGHAEALVRIAATYASGKGEPDKRTTSKAMALLPQVQAAGREAYASSIEETFIKSGMEVDVTATGEGKRILRIKYALMSQPMVYKFQNEVKIDEHARNMGFTRLILTNGFSSSLGRTWTFDLKGSK